MNLLLYNRRFLKSAISSILKTVKVYNLLKIDIAVTVKNKGMQRSLCKLLMGQPSYSFPIYVSYPVTEIIPVKERVRHFEKEYTYVGPLLWSLTAYMVWSRRDLKGIRP